MEQLVARRAHNPKAIGSNPILATKKQLIKKWHSLKTHTVIVLLRIQHRIISMCLWRMVKNKKYKAIRHIKWFQHISSPTSEL